MVPPAVRVGWVGVFYLCCVACGDDASAIDAGVECTGESTGCSSGEVCVAGRCFVACTGDRQCSRFERCSDGRCMPAAARDGGLRDSGDTDPCEGVTCEAPTPLCHPPTGECVQCLGMGDCAEPARICDIATGTCVAPAPRACAPCNVDSDCMAAKSSFGSCQTLSVSGADGRRGQERVCVSPCTDGMCGQGFRCMDGASCVPVGGCSASLAAADGRVCGGDDDCTPLGVQGEPGQCALGPAVDSGGTDAGAAMGTCLQICGTATDCPAALNCADMRFCRP
jgi:hypothetical protein